MTIIISQIPPASSRARKNDERDSTDTVIPDTVLSSNLFP